MSQHRTFQDIKIFGERNTSTNALKLLIERNSASRVLPSVAIELDPNFWAKVKMISWLPSRAQLKAYEAYVDSVFKKQRDPRYMWKHAMLSKVDPAAFSDCLVILTFRHPASWLLALRRKPHHHLQAVPSDFTEFLKQPWKPTRRDNVSGPLSVLDLYCRKVHAALEFARRLDRAGNAFTIVRFEDFAVDQEAVFDRLRPWLREPTVTFSFVESSTKENTKDRRWYADFYGKNRWMADLGAEAADFIDRHISWGDLAQLNYTKLSISA